jgi:phosphate:Na+ symporter
MILGICMLFFGIDAMKNSAAQIQEISWFQRVMTGSRGSSILAFLAGALVSFLTQSSTAVVMIVVALVKTDLLGVHETMMAIYGSNVGPTIAPLVLTGGLKGYSRQVGRFQDLFNIFGSALFVLLFYLEMYGRIPLVLALCTLLARRPETQMALVYLLCNLTVALLVLPFRGFSERLLGRYWPATEAENFARPKYLHPQVLLDPETALDLVEKEQLRLLGRLSEHINALRPQAPGGPKTDSRTLHQAFGSLFREVESYLTRLVHVSLSPSTSDRLINVHSRHELIGSLEESINQMVASVVQTPPSAKLAPLVQNLTEALDFLILTADEAYRTRDPHEVDLLAGLCADRGELLGKIRNLYLSSEQVALSPGDKLLLLGLTTLFDRIVWMVRQLAVLLQQNRQFQT